MEKFDGCVSRIRFIDGDIYLAIRGRSKKLEGDFDRHHKIII